MELPFDLVIPILGIYLKDPIKPILKNIYTSMFIVALFTIARSWKQPKCPSGDAWIKKLWYNYTVDYYTAVKRRNSYLL